MLAQPGFTAQDQWQVQIQAVIQKKADVYVLQRRPERRADPPGAVQSLPGHRRHHRRRWSKNTARACACCPTAR